MPSVICPLSIVPVRKEPSDRSEMVTQWLFGETAEVLERDGAWSRLCFDHDGYEGWVDNKQITRCLSCTGEVVHRGEDGHQLGLAARLQPDVVRAPVRHDVVHDVALGVDLDREDRA
ncbi:MAG TPA: SH3 domain-containing protein, partial [Flavobacteriales bacterium]|nr:SH3 domain-containing protein [Flavobacteriales bacterium]